jgi:hypothetical protein
VDDQAAMFIVCISPVLWTLIAVAIFHAWPGGQARYEWRLHLMFWPLMIGVLVLEWIGWAMRDRDRIPRARRVRR